MAGRARDGTLLPWRLARSATPLLFGNWGVAFGMFTVGLVILNFSISHTVVRPPSGKDNVPAQPGTRGGETAAPSRPVNPGVTDILQSPSERRPLNAADPAIRLTSTRRSRNARIGGPTSRRGSRSSNSHRAAEPTENQPYLTRIRHRRTSRRRGRRSCPVVTSRDQRFQRADQVCARGLLPCALRHRHFLSRRSPCRSKCLRCGRRSFSSALWLGQPAAL